MAFWLAVAAGLALAWTSFHAGARRARDPDPPAVGEAARDAPAALKDLAPRRPTGRPRG